MFFDLGVESISITQSWHLITYGTGIFTAYGTSTSLPKYSLDLFIKFFGIYGAGISVSIDIPSIFLLSFLESIELIFYYL
jgi:hypothetical protein